MNFLFGDLQFYLQEKFPVFWRITGLYEMESDELDLLFLFLPATIFVIGWLYDHILGKEGFGPLLNAIILLIVIGPFSYFYSLWAEPLFGAGIPEVVLILLISPTAALMGIVYLKRFLLRFR